ncbi:hypothetical protein chiPu_0032759, partial [Chiloscyllium punctatum]|nr:hypothetical protein [Chiloscyllium punctatum]
MSFWRRLSGLYRSRAIACCFWLQVSVQPRLALRQDTALKDAGRDKSAPETLTTACHAASWLARSWRCGSLCTSIGPENFPLAEAKNSPDASVPNS